MRRITFSNTDDDKTNFALMYRGWITGGEPRGKEENALAGEVMKKLWSLDKENGEGGTSIRLKEEGGTLELSEREFELFRRHVEQAPYPPAFSPKTGAMYEMLAGAEKIEQTDADAEKKVRAVS